MILYMVVALLYWMALYLYVPTLPTYVETKTETLASVGIILAQYGLWQALIRLPLGIAADWLGRRKPFIIGGLILTGVGAWVMARAGGPWGLGLGRAIRGLGAGTWVPLSVAFAALFPPQEIGWYSLYVARVPKELRLGESLSFPSRRHLAWIDYYLFSLSFLCLLPAFSQQGQNNGTEMIEVLFKGLSVGI